MLTKGTMDSMNKQRGGTLVGFILGVVVGLASALVVAIYVTKVPVPFMQKAQSRTADQDADEAKKNKDWDPNAALYGKNPAKAPAAAASAPAAAPAPAPQEAKADAKPAKPEAKADAKTDAKADSKAETKPAVSADPLGDLAKSKVAGSDAADANFVYFVQLGAYSSAEDAEAQRAKLSLSGVETKLSSKEQSGRMVHRVRVGPFDKRDEAERSKEKLDKQLGLETALVRVQK